MFWVCFLGGSSTSSQGFLDRVKPLLKQSSFRKPRSSCTSDSQGGDDMNDMNHGSPDWFITGIEKFPWLFFQPLL